MSAKASKRHLSRKYTAMQFFRNPNLVSTDMDGETVMMSIERGAYFGIGGIGPEVWERLATPQTLDSLVSAICAEYDVSAPDARRDIEAFLDRMVQNDLVKTA